MSDDSSANDALGTLRAAIKQAVTDVRDGLFDGGTQTSRHGRA